MDSSHTYSNRNNLDDTWIYQCIPGFHLNPSIMWGVHWRAYSNLRDVSFQTINSRHSCTIKNMLENGIRIIYGRYYRPYNSRKFGFWFHGGKIMLVTSQTNRDRPEKFKFSDRSWRNRLRYIWGRILDIIQFWFSYKMHNFPRCLWN